MIQVGTMLYLVALLSLSLAAGPPDPCLQGEASAPQDPVAAYCLYSAAAEITEAGAKALVLAERRYGGVSASQLEELERRAAECRKARDLARSFLKRLSLPEEPKCDPIRSGSK